jgi:hypothetical protein
MFERSYYLDIVFHNSSMIQSKWWMSHCGEYDEKGKLLAIESFCRQPETRLFASDHTAIFVGFELLDFWNGQ